MQKQKEFHQFQKSMAHISSRIGCGSCDRCGKYDNGITAMSYFNTEQICLNCEIKEKRHPKYKEAREAELREFRKDNRNFEGIGLPQDLRVK